MKPVPSGYRQAGVDLEAAEETLDRIRGAVASTYTEGVVRGLGAFGGLFELPAGYRRPVLVASTDGVGTKVELAVQRGAYASVGSDIVNHCINDILVQGAKPLFFLDYIASSKLDPAVVAEIVGGVAKACREAGMALLGGETAEMPGVYEPGALDIAGTIIGIVEKDAVIDGSAIRAGDALIGLPSGGLQTNGFTLARAVLASRLDERLGDGTVADALLAPHRSFLATLAPLLREGVVKGMAHITGGGLPGNLPRSLPAGLGARLDRGSWPVPAIFDLIQRTGEVADAEMLAVFNLGIGMVLIVDAASLPRARELLAGQEHHLIGSVVPGEGVSLDQRPQPTA